MKITTKNLRSLIYLLFISIIYISCKQNDPALEDFEEGDKSAMYGNWLRDNTTNTYIQFSGNVAKTCINGQVTTGEFSPTDPSMTFVINGEIIKFPLKFNDRKLLVGVPDQSITTHNSQTYSKTEGFCGTSSVNDGTTTSPTPNAKGSIMVWTDHKQYGFIYDSNGISVTVAGKVGTVFGGAYNSPPACGAAYCHTVSQLDPGTYTVVGKIYPIKPISGPTPPTYSTSQTVKVVAGQCTKVLIR
ncbi:hypothetical protein ACR79P_14640 [Sphingobacterium spiritivorum]|uniref:hypothetical protein n=1 Tax=Sphingobacterium spiritivorum TaxID=258 RepID=UPI003DA65331